MEQTHQYPIQFPAACAVLAEEEMIYIEGGSYSFNVGDYMITSPVSPEDIGIFCTNIVVNYARLLGQTAFQRAVAGIESAYRDGLGPVAAVQYFWKNQGTPGHVATFVFAGFVGFYLYSYAVNLYNTASSLYSDLKNLYQQTMDPQLTFVPSAA